MRTPTLLACGLALLAAVCPGALQAQTAADTDLQALFEAVEPKVIEWRRDFHEHPELSNREFRTAEKVAAHLTALGLEVQTEVAHTGVVALLRGGQPGPVVALRADMDGLPVTERVDLPFASKATGTYNDEEVGVMHACGHDTHIAILMGVAEVLTAVRDDVPGTIKFIFQPAEEGAPLGEAGGAELMVEEGVLTNPDVDAALALHIISSVEVGHITYRPGGTMASVDDFRIVVHGKQTHGASPWGGVDPIVTSAHIITALQTIVSRQLDITRNAGVVTVGRIRAGVRSNIIPEEAELIGTIRALSAEDRTAIHEKVRQIATNVAESMGATVDIEIPMSTSYPVTYNDPELTEKMVPVLQAVAGAENVHLAPAVTGAEDFSFFAEKVPGFYISLGGRPSDVPEQEASKHHTPDFFVSEDGLGLGVRAMTAMALEYLRTHSTDSAGGR